MTFFVVAFRYFSFTEDLAHRRLFEKMRLDLIKEGKQKEVEEAIHKAKEDARRVYHV